MFTKINKPPPPVPCTARPAIKIVILVETALIREPRKKVASAVSSAGFRPKMSANFPHEEVLAAVARRYALPTQVYPAE
jgi:hypothetical protein